MDLERNQGEFRGDPEDLEAFLQLANTPVRSEKRSEALATWKDYKLGKLRRLWPALSRELNIDPPTSIVLRSGGEPQYRELRGDPLTPRDTTPLYKGWQMIAMQRHLIDLTGARLDGICLGFVDLRGVKLDGASLRGAWLKGAELEWASLRNVDLSPLPQSGGGGSAARVLQADLSNTDLQGADLCYADLSDTTFRDADLRAANLSNTDLTRANLVGAHLESADLNGSRVYGISAWNVSLCEDKTKRQNLIITTPGESEVRVDDIEVAQFVYLLLNREKLRNVLNAMTQKGVLILGRFGNGGIEVLQAVAARIREMGYLPMLFDFEPSDSRDNTETVKIMVGLARFVIADLSGPSVLKELEATVADFEVPFIPIIEKGRPSPSMTRDLTKYPWFQWPPVSFENKKLLIEMLPKEVIDPAEEIGKERQERRAKLFPT